MSRIQVLELDPLVARCCALLGRVLDPRLQVAFRSGGPLPPLMGSATQLEQALIRLGLQGADALGEAGGALVFQTLRHDEGRVGLRLVVQPVEASAAPEWIGGSLRAALGEQLDALGARTESERPEGRGWALGISFPPAENYVPPTPALLPQPKAAAPVRRLDGLRVLVAEDEPEVRFFLREMLGRLGAEVVPAADGEDAWNIWSLLGPFDLLLTDQRMPRMTGMELLAKVREHRPRFPVVVMSGFGLEEFGAAFAADPRLRYLGKPFTLPALLEALGSLVALPGTAPDHG